MPTSIDMMNTDRVHLSRDELKLYASGAIPSTVQHDLEMHLEQCPLCMDAVEGFRLVPAHAQIDELAWRDHAKKDSLGKLVRGVLLGSVLLAGVWVAWKFGGGQELPDQNNAVVVTQMPQASIPIPLTEEEEMILVEEINMAVELPEEELIGTVSNEPGQAAIANQEPQGSEVEVIAEMIDTMEPKPVTIQPSASERVPNAVHSSHSSRQLIFLHDLKIVDPKELYNSGGSMQVRTRSIGADRENQLDKGDRLSGHQQATPYLQVMDNALGDVAQQRYRAALWELVVLLEAYPNDVNGLFYSGLCYYNLGLFKRAQSAFKEVEQHPFDTFKEPAAWYYALCIERGEGHEAAIPYFESIVSQRGFYSKKAEVRIKAPTP